MQDQLSQIYLESVASSPAKKTDFNGKKNTVGTVKEGEDFGAKKKGFQKGTGPDAQKKDVKKPKNLKEDADMNDEEDAPIIGSQFDSLFKKTIKEDFEPADDAGFGAPEDDLEFGGDEGEGELGSDEEGGEEPDLRSVLTSVIEQLQNVLSNVEGGAGEGEPEDIEDMDGMEDSNDPEDDTEDEDPDTVEEADAAMSRERDGKMSKAPDGKTTYQGPKKSNKVGGYFGKKTMGGQGTGDAGGSKPRDGRLRPAPGYKELQGKSNKVSSGIPSRTGANLFG